MPIPLRTDFNTQTVRAAAKRSKDGPQARRLLALAAIYEGARRTEAAKVGGVTLQIVRDWVMKFNAQGPEGLIDRKPPGQPSRLNGAHRVALAAIIESGPIPAVHGVVRWRIVDLCQWIFEEFRVVVAKQTLGRELRAMGYRKLSARPRHHAQAAGAIEDTSDDPEVTVQKKDTSDALRRCLGGLSAEHREIVDLVYYHEKSVEEVAGIIGIPENTVKTRLFYARKKLAELLKAAGIERGWP